MLSLLWKLYICLIVILVDWVKNAFVFIVNYLAYLYEKFTPRFKNTFFNCIERLSLLSQNKSLLRLSRKVKVRTRKALRKTEPYLNAVESFMERKMENYLNLKKSQRSRVQK